MSFDKVLLWISAVSCFCSTQVMAQEIICRKLQILEGAIHICESWKSRIDIVYITIHDDEKTSESAMRNLIHQPKFLGRWVDIQNNNSRMIILKNGRKKCQVDPNRIFTAEGRTRHLKDRRCYSIRMAQYIKQFAAELIKILKEPIVIIAVHNNSDSPNSKNFSIKSYLEGGRYQSLGEEVYWNPSIDDDDFFLTTGEKFFKYFKEKKWSTVLQKKSVRRLEDDGSLSIYCAQNQIPYINIEVEHGHKPEQIKMLEMTQEVLKILVGFK